MNGAQIRQRLKPWMLPAAMLCGVLFHEQITDVAFVVPYLIFTMLLITFCRIDPQHFGFSKMTWPLLAVQMLGSSALFLAISPFDRDIAQGLFICVLCPTATAAPVITGMLGGSVTRVVAYSIVNNVTVALAAPFLLTWVGNSDIDIIDTALSILSQVTPMILGPLILALSMHKFTPKVKQKIASIQSASFYIWTVALFIAVGKATAFVMKAPSEEIPAITTLALGAGVVCITMFFIGHKIGLKHGDSISGAQGLGQKNTILAICMALNFLNPIASVAPAAYIAWHNIINSTQLYLHQKRQLKNNI